MGTTTKTRTVFGDRLRAELNRQSLSVRALARKMDPTQPERARRNLNRWIAGMKPTRGNRLIVSAALGVDASYFDEDDEEEDELADLVHLLRPLPPRRALKPGPDACTYAGLKGDTPPPWARAGVRCFRKATVTLRENYRRGGNPFRERRVCRTHADEMIAEGYYFEAERRQAAS